MSMLRDLGPEDLRAALDGRADVAALVEALLPLIQVRVARVLRRANERFVGPDLRQEVEDQTQEVLLSLFRDGGRVLRRWVPGQGLSLPNYVGLVAERWVLSTVRSGKKTWREAILPNEDLDTALAAPDAERRTAARQLFGRLLERLQADLSVYGWRMFQLLFLEEKSVADVGREMATTTDAIYAWRSRLRRRARELLEALETEDRPTRRIPTTEAAAAGGASGPWSASSTRRGEG